MTRLNERKQKWDYSCCPINAIELIDRNPNLKKIQQNRVQILKRLVKDLEAQFRSTINDS